MTTGHGPFRSTLLTASKQISIWTGPIPGNQDGNNASPGRHIAPLPQADSLHSYKYDSLHIEAVDIQRGVYRLSGEATISRLRRKPYTNSRSSSTPTAREIYFKPARTMISHILIKGKAFSGFPFYSSISASYSAFSPNGYWFWCTSSKRIPFS